MKTIRETCRFADYDDMIAALEARERGRDEAERERVKAIVETFERGTTMNLCKNYLDTTAPPGCRMMADERYTMRFDDIGEEPIYWCAACGPLVQEIDALIDEAFETRPGFAEEFRDAIEGER